MKSKLFLSIAALLCCAILQAQPPRQADIVPGRLPDSPTFEEYFSPVSDAFATPDEKGFIRRWLILEPISKPNRSNTVFTDSYVREALNENPDLTKSLPSDGKTVKLDGQKLKWHAVDSRLFNVKLFRFAAGLKKEVYGVVFHAMTVIDCPEDLKDIRMATGSNGASMWWIDGKETVIMSSDRRMVVDDCMSKRITLAKGRHIIRCSVINGPGMSDMCVRFVDSEGKPVTNFKVLVK